MSKVLCQIFLATLCNAVMRWYKKKYTFKTKNTPKLN